MARQLFSQWIKQTTPPQRFVCFDLQVSRSVWENTLLPQCRDRYRADRIIRITTEHDWEGIKSDLLQPSLFARRTLLVLEEVADTLAAAIWKEHRLGSETFIIYLLPEQPGKSWRSFPIVTIALSGRRQLEDLIERCGKTINPEALDLLVRLWREYNLKPEDIEQWAVLIDQPQPIRVQDVEGYFQKSEKVLLFGFLDAVSEKRVAPAQRFFIGLMRQGYPPSLFLSNLARRFRLILQVLETDEKERDLWKGTMLSPFEFSKIQRTAAHFDSDQIAEMFKVLNHIDRQLKSQSIPFEILMLDFFIAIDEMKRLA